MLVVTTNYAEMSTYNEDKLEGVDIRLYGAHSIDEPGYENFDSSYAIQKALNDRGVIDLGSGIYNVSKQLHIYNDTTIISDGAVVNKMFDVDWNEYLFVNYETVATNITFKDTIFNLKPNDSIKDENAVFISLRNQVKNLTFDNVTFKNAGNWCVALTRDGEVDPIDYSKNITIKDCTVESVDSPKGLFFVLMQVDGFSIEGNYFNKGKGQIFLSYAKNGEVIGNTIEGLDNYWGSDRHLGGIDLYNGCENIVVDSNKLSSNGNINEINVVAIRSKNNTDITISNNEIEWNNLASEAISIRKDDTSNLNTSNHYIIGNTITGSVQNGIRLISLVENRSIDNVYIEDNILKTSLIILHPTAILNNISYNNIYIDNNICAGISSWECPNYNSQITNNTVYAEGDAGIYARDMVNATVTGNKVINNNGVLDYGIDYSYSIGITVGRNTFVNTWRNYKNYYAKNITVVN